MRMKTQKINIRIKALALIVSLIMFISAFEIYAGELDYRGEFQAEGGARKITISPDKRIWFCSSSGNTYYSRNINESWNFGAHLTYDTSSALSPPNFVKMAFFDNDGAIIVGWILGVDGHNNSIYQTGNGGETWNLIKFGDDEWIYDVFTSDDGHAWMGGSQGNIYYSADYGISWVKKTAPYDDRIRTFSIFMLDSLTGIVGGMKNAISITRDNCQNWSRIKTPLDQKVYDPATSRSYGDRVYKAVIHDSNIIVNQDGRVFWSSLDSINWRYLDGQNLIDFAYDNRSNTLYGIDEQLHVVKYDNQLKAAILNPHPLYNRPTDIECKDGHVYAIDNNMGIYEVTSDSFKFSYALTDQHQTKNMNFVQKYGNTLWGMTFTSIYNSSDYGKNWYRVGTSHLKMFGFHIKDDNDIFVFNEKYKIQIFNRVRGSFTDVSDLQSEAVLDMVQKDGVWYACGALDSCGFVAVSRDANSWQIIDRWPADYAEILFVDKGNNITLQSEQGSIRRLEYVDGEYSGHDIIIADSSNITLLPRFDVPLGIYFPNERLGYATGWSDLINEHCFRTEDGGKTWSRIKNKEFPYRYMINYGEYYLGVSATSLTLIYTDSTQQILDITDYCKSENCTITNVNLDNKSDIFVRTNDNYYLLFKNKQKAWRKLN